MTPGMSLAPIDPDRSALVLAGAGSKGAFEAGAAAELIRAGHRFGTVVGASAGALNGALLAAAVRAGREEQGAQILRQRWLQSAGFWDVFQPTVAGIVSGRGFSTGEKLAEQLEESAAELFPGAAAPSRYVAVVTALRGRPVEVGGRAATSYELPVCFGGTDFDSPQARAIVFRAAVASAAVPLAFVPVDLEGFGACADGGLVNNTPLKHALADPKVTRLFVLVPYPSPVAPPPPRSWLSLAGHCIDVLIQERLVRDLHEAVDINAQLAAADRLGLTEEARRELGLWGRRTVEIVQVRPPEELEGTAFSGLGDRALRAAQIEAGRLAAIEALARPATTT